MAFLAVAATGPTDLIAAQAGKVIIVEAIYLVSGGAVTLTFQSVQPGGAATTICGPMVFATPFIMNVDSVQMGVFQTDPGGGLRMTGGSATVGFIRYSMRG